jgi:hypothetical protein
LRILQVVIVPIVMIFLISAIGDFIGAWRSADPLDWGIFWSAVWLGPQLGVPLFTITILLMRDRTNAVEQASFAQPPNQTDLAELAGRSPALAVAAPDGASHQLNKGRLRLEIVLLMLQLPSLALAGVGWGAQHLQQRYLDGLPAQVRAERPLYANSLAQPNGDWPNQQPSAANGYQTYTYESGAYHLRGVDSQRFMYASGTKSYGDIAVEVTTSERGQHFRDGVGVVMDATPDGSKFVVCYVDLYGDWLFYRYDATAGSAQDSWVLISAGQSTAIHVGPTATNQLLVVHRGGQFLVYVNDVFLRLFPDDSTPTAGRMGVFLESADTEGIFSQFAVYPALS